jgi:hypothetical protein
MYKLIVRTKTHVYSSEIDCLLFHEQVEKDNYIWVEDYLNEEVFDIMQEYSIEDENIEDYYLQDKNNNRLDIYR